MTTQDFVVKTAQLDEMVRPWLQQGDQWRYDPDGFPVLDDMLTAYYRFVGPTVQPDLRLIRHPDGCATIADANYGFRGTGDTTSEAMFQLLYDVLVHVPAEWRNEG